MNDVGFDIEVIKRGLLEAALPLAERADVEKIKASKTLIFHADGMLTDALDCLLVGWKQHMDWVVSKSRIFAEAAGIEHYAGFCDEFIQARRYRTLALLDWLQNRSPETNQQLCIEWLRKYHDRAGRALRSDHFEDAAVDFVSAGVWKGLEELAAACGWLEIPQRLNVISGEGSISLGIARHALYGDYDSLQVQQGIRTMLNTQIPLWLEGGQIIRCVQWLKIAYGKGSNLSPYQTILMVYQHLPDVTPPAEVAECIKSLP